MKPYGDASRHQNRFLIKPCARIMPDVIQNDRASVVSGLSQTGGLITSAALIMVVLFGSFGFTRLVATREFGLGLAFAVALDATLIRLVLVPILMGLMGRANWWWPKVRRARLELAGE